MLHYVSAHPQSIDALKKFLSKLIDTLQLDIDMKDVDISEAPDRRWVMEMVSFKHNCPEMFEKYKPEANDAEDLREYLAKGLDDDEGGIERKELSVIVKGTLMIVSLRDMFKIEQGFDG